jgi:hypothetical protein
MNLALAQMCRHPRLTEPGFVAHDADYRASKKDWETFVESLTEKITEQDGTIPELPAKDLVSYVFLISGSAKLTRMNSALGVSYTPRHQVQ